MLGFRTASGIGGNPDCVGVGLLVGGVQCWLVHAACVSVLCVVLVSCDWFSWYMFQPAFGCAQHPNAGRNTQQIPCEYYLQ